MYIEMQIQICKSVVFPLALYGLIEIIFSKNLHLCSSKDWDSLQLSSFCIISLQELWLIKMCKYLFKLELPVSLHNLPCISIVCVHWVPVFKCYQMKNTLKGYGPGSGEPVWGDNFEHSSRNFKASELELSGAKLYMLALQLDKRREEVQPKCMFILVWDVVCHATYISRKI